MHNSLLRLLTLAVALFLMVGCSQAAAPGGTGPDETKATGGEPKIDPSRCEPGKEWWRSTGPAVRGGTLVMGAQPVTVEHLDPTASGSVGYRVYEELLVSRGCFTGDLLLQPYLAKAWTVSNDGLTWTLTLRDDVKWQNLAPVSGRKFVSSDVKFSMEHHLSGSIAKALWDGVASMDTPDDKTVIIKLKTSDADFGAKLGFRDNKMVPKEVKAQYGDFKTVAVGTGPFIHKDYKPGVMRQVVKNPDYWDMGIDGKPLPYIDGMNYATFADTTAELAAMRANQLDVGNTLAYRKQDWDQVKQSNTKLVPWQGLQATWFGVWFNIAEKPWDDVRVRKAVAMALNSEDLIISDGNGSVLSGLIPPFFKEYAWPDAKLKEKYKQDITAAKKLLADAGYKPGDIKDSLKSSGAYSQLAEVVQQQLAAIGIETSVDTSVSTSFTTVVRDKKYKIAAGIIGGSPLTSYWASDVVRTGSSYNYSNLADREVDRLALAQGSELDPVKRKVLTDQLQERVYEIMPVVPATSRVYYYFYSCRAKNTMYITSNQTHNEQFVTQMWIDPTGC